MAEAKSAIVAAADGFEFLGFRIYGKYLRPRNRSLSEFKQHIRALSPRHTSEAVPSIIAKLNPVIRGWGNHHAIGHVAELYDALDKQIRTRLRSHLLRPDANRYPGKLPNKALQRLGLVSLVDLCRSQTSPVPGLRLG